MLVRVSRAMNGGLRPKRFRAIVDDSGRGRMYIAVPFDPNQVWGARERHHVHGRVNDVAWRGPLERMGKKFVLRLGPAWRRDAGVGSGDSVSVELFLEGPQREALAADIQAALDAEPEAAKFFDALANFYKKAYLKWVDSTKGRPDARAARIAELVDHLAAGRKQRPR